MVDIIYEDNHLLVVNKPVNVPSQEDSSKDKDMLAILKEYIKEKHNKPGNVYLGLVHRLDRPTSGVMVFAKTSKCASRLSEQIRTNKLRKIYNAVVIGNIEKSNRLVDNLLKDTKNNIVKVDKRGKTSILEFEKINCIDDLSLIKVELLTGRSHQIRVQLSNHGYPLYGDQKYNKKSSKGEQLALISKSIEFLHPITKEEMHFEIDIPNRYPFNLFK